MKKREVFYVSQRLQTLIGQPLHDAGYAADMLSLEFGEGGESCLHIQCSYRMASEEAILFDRIDYFCPSDVLRAKWRAEGLDDDDFP